MLIKGALLGANGSPPVQCQTITYTSNDLSSIGPQGTNFTKILATLWQFTFKKKILKMSSVCCRPFSSGIMFNSWRPRSNRYHFADDIFKCVFLNENVLTHCGLMTPYNDRSGSTLAQVMACCLTAPSHYLNQCWLIISEVQSHVY